MDAALDQKKKLAETVTQSPRSGPKWFAAIDDARVEIPDPTVRVSVLRAQAEISADQVIVRDHNSPNDTVLKDAEIVDLRGGNVFYSLPKCDVKPQPACGEPAKIAMSVDDRLEVIGTKHQTGRTIRELFELPRDVHLFRDLHSPNDTPIGNDDVANFDDGPVFVTREPEKRVIEYTVDDEPQSTTKHTLTPKEILHNAGIDPATHYLVQIIGNKQESYKDKPDEPIHMHQHMKFVSVSTGSTPVS